MLIRSIHKEINGNLDGKPFEVVFDSNGEATVNDAVGEYLRQLNSAEIVPEDESESDNQEKESKELDVVTEVKEKSETKNTETASKRGKSRGDGK